jgi:hypothetical protein
MTNNPVKLFLKKQGCFSHNSSKTILDQDEKKPTPFGVGRFVGVQT